MTKQKLLIPIGLALLVACVHKNTNEQSKALELNQWQYKMMGLSESLSRLLPLVYSPRAFNDPKNYGAIERDTKTLATMAHTVDRSKKPSGDPSLDFVSAKFSADMNEAVHQLDLGNRKFARFLIRNSTGYCIACHTRNDQGRKNLNLSVQADVSGLSYLDRAEFHSAMRDFDAAVKDYDQIVNSPDAQLESPQTMEVAAERTLAVAVRVKRDPDMAMQVVDRTTQAKWAPIYLKLNSLAWKTAIQEWQKEASRPNVSLVQQLAKAKSLLQKGWKFSASSPQSRAGLVYFLRASTLLHDVLSVPEKNPAYGEGLYLAGLAAESLRDINLWTMHESYYEACIRYQPFTDLAKRCYLRYEALQLAAYSDGEGSYMPAHIRDHLRELKSQAVKQEGDFLDWGFVE